MSALTFQLSDSTGRFAALNAGVVIFETYHLDASERAKLREALRTLDETAWANGHDAAVGLAKEFAATLHIVRADR